jgi:hypothetical protein
MSGVLNLERRGQFPRRVVLLSDDNGRTIIPKIYLNKLPAEIPAGLVLVHNQVHPSHHLRARGFRA